MTPWLITAGSSRVVRPGAFGGRIHAPYQHRACATVFVAAMTRDLERPRVGSPSLPSGRGLELEASTTRKPLFGFLSPGCLSFRQADRQCTAELFQLPPRNTRPLPLFGNVPQLF